MKVTLGRFDRWVVAGMVIGAPVMVVLRLLLSDTETSAFDALGIGIVGALFGIILVRSVRGMMWGIRNHASKWIWWQTSRGLAIGIVLIYFLTECFPEHLTFVGGSVSQRLCWGVLFGAAGTFFAVGQQLDERSIAGGSGAPGGQSDG